MQTGAAMNNRPVTYKIGQVVEFVDLIERERAEDQFQITPTSRWYVAVTNPNCQARAALGLHELGYRSFYPKIRRWVSHARVKTAKEKPLLGRYIFVEVDQPRQSFGAARKVNGIEGFVCNPDPVRIPNQFVQHMRERYVYGEWDFVRQEPCPFYEWNAVTGQMELQTRTERTHPDRGSHQDRGGGIQRHAGNRHGQEGPPDRFQAVRREPLWTHERMLGEGGMSKFDEDTLEAAAQLLERSAGNTLYEASLACRGKENPSAEKFKGKRGEF
jgi:transcription antitermination factor NusG